MSDTLRLNLTLLPAECFALIAQNYSLEALIHLAKNPAAPSAEDPMLFSHGKRHLGEDSNYALAPRPRRLQPNEKEAIRIGALQVIDEHLKLLVQNNVRLMGKPGKDEPHLIFEQTIKEQQREIAALVIKKNSAISATQKAQLAAAASIEGATYVGDIIAIDALLNEVNMTLMQPCLDAYEARPEEQRHYLKLSGLGLTRLPEELIITLQRYPALTILSISVNNLTTLPESFGSLVKVTHLYLTYNQLIALPGSFDNLVALLELNLVNNKLDTLPESMRQILIKTNNQNLFPLLAQVPISMNESNEFDDGISTAAAAATYTPSAKKQGQKRKVEEENTSPQNSAAAEEQSRNKRLK